MITDDCLSGPLFTPGDIKVYLTLSPLARTRRNNVVEQRQIQLNWDNGQYLAEDWIGLFPFDPTIDLVDPLVRISPTAYDGVYKTNVQFGFPVDKNRTLAYSCLGYWVGYVRNGTVIASNCLKIQPTWMWDNR